MHWLSDFFIIYANVVLITWRFPMFTGISIQSIYSLRGTVRAMSVPPNHIQSSLNIHTHEDIYTCTCTYLMPVYLIATTYMHMCIFMFGFISMWAELLFQSTEILVFLSLGEHHIGYKRKDLPGQKLSIIGGRPLSCGGDAFSYSHDIVVERFVPL
jgi:hypothetical protein